MTEKYPQCDEEFFTTLNNPQNWKEDLIPILKALLKSLPPNIRDNSLNNSSCDLITSSFLQTSKIDHLHQNSEEGSLEKEFLSLNEDRLNRESLNFSNDRRNNNLNNFDNNSESEVVNFDPNSNTNFKLNEKIFKRRNSENKCGNDNSRAHRYNLDNSSEIQKNNKVNNIFTDSDIELNFVGKNKNQYGKLLSKSFDIGDLSNNGSKSSIRNDFFNIYSNNDSNLLEIIKSGNLNVKCVSGSNKIIEDANNGSKSSIRNDYFNIRSNNDSNLLEIIKTGNLNVKCLNNSNKIIEDANINRDNDILEEIKNQGGINNENFNNEYISADVEEKFEFNGIVENAQNNFQENFNNDGISTNRIQENENRNDNFKLEINPKNTNIALKREDLSIDKNKFHKDHSDKIIKSTKYHTIIMNKTNCLQESPQNQDQDQKRIIELSPKVNFIFFLINLIF